jgi:hypothetical protein
LEANLANGNNDNSSNTRSGFTRRGTGGTRDDVDSKAEDMIDEMSNQRKQIVEALTEERVK